MYKNKSVDILKVIIKICYVMLALVTFAVWLFATGSITLNSDGFKLIDKEEIKLISFSFYFVVPAGYIALVCIDKLLTNVKKNMIFENITIKNLNVICLACVYAAAVGIASAVISIVTGISEFIIVLTLLSLGELFMALILQVIKQVFKKAIAIKEENELTI